MTKIEMRLTPEQLQELGNRIIFRFYDNCQGGDRYGVDWPTARVLWPRECRVFDRLKAEYRKKSSQSAMA